MDNNSLTYLEQEKAFIKQQKKIAIAFICAMLLCIAWFIFQLFNTLTWIKFLIYPMLALDFYLLYRNVKNVIECNRLLKICHEIVRR